MRSLSNPWRRLERWLGANAPHTRASLLPPVAADQVREVVARHGRHAPEELVALYALAEGQRLDARAPQGGGAQGIFDGFWFMPIDGVDGLDRALADFRVAMDAGADWAMAERFPFAKDFGGTYLCLEVPRWGDAEARVVEVGDGDPRDVSACLADLLDGTVTRLEDGDVVIDERAEERERFAVLFDATRERSVGDPARHSVFEQLAVTATIEDLGQLFGPFTERPAQLFGLAARLVSDRAFDVEDVVLVDANDRPFRVTAGRQSGGGAPGVLVFAWDRRPLPNGSRLRVTLASIRRVEIPFPR